MVLARAADCGLDRQQYPSQFRINELAAGLSTAFLIFASLLYLWNIGCRAYQIVSRTRPAANTVLKPKRPDLAVNPLSALLASVVGLVLIFGTWPQPLEGAGLLVVVLAQASVLGWQNQHLKWKKEIPEKLPDVAAVIVAAYALYDARNKYIETTGNDFSSRHDPISAVLLTYALTGAGCLIGMFQQVLVALAKTPLRKQLVLRICSVLFVAIHFITFARALYFGINTIPDGCHVFNMTKISALVASGLSLAYSAGIGLWRSLADTVKDLDQDALC